MQQFALRRSCAGFGFWRSGRKMSASQPKGVRAVLKVVRGTALPRWGRRVTSRPKRCAWVSHTGISVCPAVLGVFAAKPHALPVNRQGAGVG